MDAMADIGSGGMRRQDDSSTAVEGVFRGRTKLRRAVNALMANGVPTNTIHVYLVDTAGVRQRELSVETGSGALKGALIGAGAGAAVGLVIVLLGVSGAFGPTSVEFFGVGTLVGAARAMALGATAGVPLGALLGMGHWQGARRVPGADFDRFHASVVVESPAKADVARRVLGEVGAEQVVG